MLKNEVKFVFYFLHFVGLNNFKFAYSQLLQKGYKIYG